LRGKIIIDQSSRYRFKALSRFDDREKTSEAMAIARFKEVLSAFK
jgi:hypothetical protein